MKPKIIAIIPARGGSKGIPRKNIRLLAGKPLIAYSIESALKSKYIDKVIVSTEDEEIAEISKLYGADVIKRPINLAGDDILTIDVIFHVLDSLENKKYNPDVVVLLQPTSPLRNTKDIDEAVKLFLENNCESLVSVCEMKHIYWSFRIQGKYLESLFGEDYLKKRRQDLDRIYIPNGAIYISTPKILHKYKSFYCKKMIPYIMPIEKSIDIDNEMDLEFAEFLLRKDYDKNKNRK